MRKANQTARNAVIEQRLGETVMNPYSRSRALQVMREAEAIADVIVWLKERISSLGAFFLKPGLKH